jgi:hypothetical protein
MLTIWLAVFPALVFVVALYNARQFGKLRREYVLAICVCIAALISLIWLHFSATRRSEALFVGLCIGAIGAITAHLARSPDDLVISPDHPKYADVIALLNAPPLLEPVRAEGGYAAGEVIPGLEDIEDDYDDDEDEN